MNKTEQEYLLLATESKEKFDKMQSELDDQKHNIDDLSVNLNKIFYCLNDILSYNKIKGKTGSRIDKYIKSIINRFYIFENELSFIFEAKKIVLSSIDYTNMLENYGLFILSDDSDNDSDSD